MIPLLFDLAVNKLMTDKTQNIFIQLQIILASENMA